MVCADAVLIAALPYTIHFSNAADSDDPDVLDCEDTPAYKARWFKWVAPSNGSVIIAQTFLQDPNDNADITIFYGTCGALTLVDCDSSSVHGSLDQFSIFHPGATYFFLINGYDDEVSTDITFTLSEPWTGFTCFAVASCHHGPTPPGPPITYPLRRLRRTPQMSNRQLWTFFSMFQLDLAAGLGPTDLSFDPQVGLSWSDDGGHTWKGPFWVSAGPSGEYKRRAIWRQLGRARSRVWQIETSDPYAVRWLAAYIDAQTGLA